MPDQPKSLARSKAQASAIAGLSFACMLLASPLMAQEAAPAATAPSASAPAVGAPVITAPAITEPSISAPATDAPATPAQPAQTDQAGTGAAVAPSGTTSSTTPEAPRADAATTQNDAAPQSGAQAPAAQPIPAATGATSTDPNGAPSATGADGATPSAAPQPATPDSAANPAAAGVAADGAAVAPATTTEAVTEPQEVPFAPNADSLLPDAVQRVLAPVLSQTPRDPNLPHDLSPIGMFMAADIVVKAVMIGLAFASVATWTVLVVKLLELGRASSNALRARRRIDAASSLSEAVTATGKRNDPASRMVRAAMEEYQRSAPALDRAGDEGTKDRVGSILSQIEANASRRIARGTGVLATIGSTAPFVGLFGTVWGIMNSFISISESQTTNLAIVAPGIAEALLATAIGLVAAIPAVVIYNVFARAITGYRLRLANASAGVQRLVSRDLDFRTEN
ncbi:tonB-system energizer ExbB [Paracoccus sp. (in: a-proteobacteria)]|uniref:tonB-system energizer ExbB n=1 Tax=Paracoccus sp. TaxID=267 RepID=UPI0028987FDF|nr:tonB-system energizer ExbB [Paracoccus sp. (in: a-proteobacteria)]